jgi:hypothetical protein
MIARKTSTEQRRNYTADEIYEMSKLSPRRRALQALARTAITIGRSALDQNRNPIADYTKYNGWDRDETFNALLKGSVNPATTSQAGWAAEVAHVAQSFLVSLTPLAAGAALLQQCLTLNFDRANKILLPAIAPGIATFIAQGAPYPAKKLSTTASAILTPAKMGSIVALTREMLESSNAEAVITQALLDSAAPGLDQVLFSANAAVADTSPAGILLGITPITASASSIQSEAMADDLSALVGAVAAKSGNNNIAFIAAPQQATRIMLQSENMPWPVLSTAALAKGTVIIVALNALVSSVEPPTVEASRDVTYHAEDTNPSADPTLGPRINVYHMDSVALRLRFPVTWAVRDPAAISFVTATKW